MLHRVVFALVLSACGPSPGTETTVGGASTGDTDQPGEPPTTSGSNESSDDSSTGAPPVGCGFPGSVDPFPAAPTCDDFAVEPPAPDLAINLVNDRSEAVFVLGSSPQDRVLNYLLVEGEAGGRAVQAPFTCSLQPPLCDELLVGDPEECVLTNRRGPIRIEPGAQHTLVWTPYIHFPVELPAACRPDGSPTTTCTASRAPRPGTYRFLIVHGTQCDGLCECDAGEDSCILSSSSAHPRGEVDTAETMWDGQCPSLDIVIE